jgi:pilus assembly protein CpaE
MRTPGSNSHAANVVVVGVDPKAMGQVRETLGTEAVLPSAPVTYGDAVAAVRKIRPDVVITGFDSDFDEAIRVAPQILGENARMTMVALSGRADPDRIRSAMRAGYREYVVLPDDAELLRQAVRDSVYSDAADEDAGEVVALWGSKGGVGSTFLAVNLAAELSPVHRVALVDLDLSMGDVAAFLDLQPTTSFPDLVRNIGRMDERMLAGHVLIHSSKVHVIAQPLELDAREEVRGDTVMRVLTVVARSYQYVIVDCGSRLDETTLTTATVADRILIVTTPDVPGIKNTWRRLQLLERLGIDKNRIHLVLNKWDKKAPTLTIADIEGNLNRKVGATVSLDPFAVKAVNDGKLIRDLNPRSPAAKEIEALVGIVTDGEVVTEKKPQGPLSWLFGS